MDNNIFNMIPGIDHEEYQYLKAITQDLDEKQVQTFISIYNGKRQKSDAILIATIVGFFGIGGIQRFMTNQIGMGILFLLTLGLCYIGTIVDLINYKKLTLEYNQEMARQAVQMTKFMN